jgi:predicted enzyme related to lactoylglutathione lyase
MTEAVKEATVRVKEFGFTSYPVSDFARARKFYEEVLNLKPNRVHEHDNPNVFSSAEYDLGSSTLVLLNCPTNPAPLAPNTPPSIPCLALEVEDFQEAVQALRNHGVKFIIEPFDTPVCSMGLFQDPDGNPLLLHKIKAGASSH